MNDTINYEAIERLYDAMMDFARKVGEIIGEIAEKLGEIIAEKLGETNNPKYRLVKSLVKPYKQPFIKVRYRARDNL